MLLFALETSSFIVLDVEFRSIVRSLVQGTTSSLHMEWQLASDGTEWVDREW